MLKVLRQHCQISEPLSFEFAHLHTYRGCLCLRLSFRLRWGTQVQPDGPDESLLLAVLGLLLEVGLLRLLTHLDSHMDIWVLESNAMLPGECNAYLLLSVQHEHATDSLILQRHTTEVQISMLATGHSS